MNLKEERKKHFEFTTDKSHCPLDCKSLIITLPSLEYHWPQLWKTYWSLPTTNIPIQSEISRKWNVMCHENLTLSLIFCTWSIMTFPSSFKEKKSSISKPCVREKKKSVLNYIILNWLQDTVSLQCLISQWTETQTNCSSLLSLHFCIREL